MKTAGRVTILAIAATVFHFTVAAAQNAKALQSQGLELLLHLELKNYTDKGLHDKFSHACVVAVGGEKYLALGTVTGTYMMRYTDYVTRGPFPVKKVKKEDEWFFPGAYSIWRECQGRELANGTGRFYVVTEGQNHQNGLVSLDSTLVGGIQIIQVEAGKALTLTNTFIGQFNTAHTITLKDSLAFVNGASWRMGRTHQHFPQDRSHLGGMRILDLSDPDNPKDIGGFGDFRKYPAQYTHDSYAYGRFYVGCDHPGDFCSRQYLVYSADIFFGWIRVLDVWDPTRVVVLDSVRTYFAQKLLSDSSIKRPDVAFTHNVWASEDRCWLFATEELKGSGISIFNICDDPRHPKFVTHYRPPTVADSSVAHNVYVRKDRLYVSWYTEGVHVFDISDPANPKEIAWFDTSDRDPNDLQHGAMQGNWSVVVDSDGNIIIVDMQRGLFILRLKP